MLFPMTVWGNLSSFFMKGLSVRNAHKKEKGYFETAKVTNSLHLFCLFSSVSLSSMKKKNWKLAFDLDILL